MFIGLFSFWGTNEYKNNKKEIDRQNVYKALIQLETMGLVHRMLKGEYTYTLIDPFFKYYIRTEILGV